MLRQEKAVARRQPRVWQKPAWKTKVTQANTECKPPCGMAEQFVAGTMRNERVAAVGDDTN